MSGDKDKDRRFRAERAAQAKRGAAIQSDTFAEISAYLTEAERRIKAALAGTPTEFEAYRLSQLQGEVRRAMAAWESSASGAISRGMDQSWSAGQDLVTEPLRAAGVDITARLTAIDTRMLDSYKVMQTDRIRDYSTTAINRINTEIGQAALGVQTPFEAASKVARHLDDAGGRARMLVRTELGAIYAAAGHARIASAIKAGVTGLRKQWRRSGKLHPRLTHELADGQVQEIDSPFMVGGGRIMFPRAPDAPVGERVNCGCTLLPWMDHWRVRDQAERPYTDEELATSTSARKVEQIRADVARAAPKPADQGLDARLAAAVIDARHYLVTQGLSTRHEHLVALDEATGLAIARHTSGKAGSVEITADLIAVIEDPAKKIALYHNHPRSTALSVPDILRLDRFPGVSSIAAYGHDGGQTVIRRGARWGEKAFKSFIQAVDEITRREIQRRVNAGEISTSDASILHTWARMMILAKTPIVDVVAEPGRRWYRLVESAAWLDDFAERAAAQLMELAL
ncbi:MAG: hypothetical protein PHS60_10915 [Zavarzinia sp.]|nr:hypothetical protein [Zavarzinia sp.]